jgi:hypothetical protein
MQVQLLVERDQNECIVRLAGTAYTFKRNEHGHLVSDITDHDDIKWVTDPIHNTAFKAYSAPKAKTIITCGKMEFNVEDFGVAPGLAREGGSIQEKKVIEEIVHDEKVVGSGNLSNPLKTLQKNSRTRCRPTLGMRAAKTHLPRLLLGQPRNVPFIQKRGRRDLRRGAKADGSRCNCYGG